MSYNPKEVRRRKVLITNNILHKQDAGLTPELQTPNNCEQKVDDLQSEESRRRKVLITYNILHKQGTGLTPEFQKHNNPANRKVMLYNPKEVEIGRWF
jgi:hypothetical protein